jgi:hypothetical protein
MNAFFELLMLASLVGAADVGFFHLYRFRLYEQPGSVAEELTHLARHVLFLGIVLVMLLAPPWARAAVLVLFVADLANTVADVLLERSSRAPLGGLPSAEYLLHALGNLLTGAAAATFYWTGPGALSPMQLGRGWLTVGIGAVLLAVEASLFARALAARARAPTAIPG